MLTLWYIVLGWKEYNKPFRRAEQPAKPVEPAKKSDLIPPRKDGPTLPTDNKKPEPPKTIPIEPRPPAPRDPANNNRIPETPKISDVKPSFPSISPEVPKISDFPKTPELPKVAPKTPELPKVAPKTPELPKVTPKTPELPKMPESPKMPEPPKTPQRTPETPKVPEFKLAPEFPKKPEVPKTPESSRLTQNTPDSPKSSDSPKLPEGLMPSRRPESVMPEFSPSGKNPYFPQPNPSEFDLPPYLPGTPQNKPLSRDDELFALGNNFNNPSPNRPIGNLRDLSYAKGEFPGENMMGRVQEAASRLPKYMEQSVISNPDSLESDEEDEDM